MDSGSSRHNEDNKVGLRRSKRICSEWGMPRRTGLMLVGYKTQKRKRKRGK